MYRIVAIKVDLANDDEMEFISEVTQDERLANKFYDMIVTANCFYTVRLEEYVFGQWRLVS